MKIKFIHSILFVFAILMIVPSISFAQNNTSLGSEQDITELLIGFNRRSDNGIWWTDDSFIDLVAEMNPDIVRYPAGTQANYWDWRTGKFIDNTDKPWNNKEILHIPEFINALPERTKVVYVVNMARPTPASGVDVNADEETLKSYATLDVKIEDMLAAIDEFTNQGKEPFAIELGNEFFFGNIESGMFHIIEDNGNFYSGWDYENNTHYISNSKQDATVFNAELYINHCDIIVEAIKAEYPDTKILLTTTKSGNGNSTRDKWNQTVFDELENNPEYSDLKSHIYAITQHHYINDNYGSPTVIHNNYTAKVAIAEGISYPMSRQADYDMVPNDYKIWYTEYGVSKDNAEETWATGLRYAAYALSWLDRGPKVGQLGYHYISDNNVVKTGSPMKFAPIGIAAQLLLTSSVNATEMQKISFSNNPNSVNEIKSLHGYKFKNATKEALIIININNQEFNQIQIDNLFDMAGPYHLTQYYSNQPYISGVYDGHSNILSNLSDIETGFNSPKFSISIIETDHSTAINENASNRNDISVYPNPFSNKIIIEGGSSKENKILIYNILGQSFECEQINTLNNKTEIMTNHIPDGIYIIKLNKQSFTVYKQSNKRSR